MESSLAPCSSRSGIEVVTNHRGYARANISPFGHFQLRKQEQSSRHSNLTGVGGFS